LLEGSIDNIMRKTGRSRDEAVAELAKHNPQGRLVTPAEVADTVLVGGKMADVSVIMGLYASMTALGVVLALFVVWQKRNRGEPLVPLALFADRNFSLANVAISAVGARWL